MPYVVGTQIREPQYWGSTGQTLVPSRSEIAGAATTFAPALVDHADGNYTVTYTPSASGRHIWMGETSDGIPVTFDWDVLTAAQADPAQALSGVTVTSQNPVATVGARLTLRNGDDYNAILGNVPSWAYTGPTDLTGATVTLTITSRTVEVSTACTVANAGSATQTITAELTGVQTATLLQSEVTGYEVAALSGADTVTLFTGKVTVQPDPTP